MLAAQAYTDPIALGLPENVPERVRLLAEEITEEHESVYEKARALAWHLRDNYEYAFATEDDEALPEGRDAVDLFLFDTKKGTCGQFSSAFVVLARSVGIPARVVSGWVISEGVELSNGLRGPGPPMGRGGFRGHRLEKVRTDTI